MHVPPLKPQVLPTSVQLGGREVPAAAQYGKGPPAMQVSGAVQLEEALRELNDVLGLRDCRLDQPIFFADQPELLPLPSRTPGCARQVGKRRALAGLPRRWAVMSRYSAIRVSAR